MASLSALSPVSVARVVELVAASAAFPSHLVSQPLRQRHRFLALDQNDPAYLSWPASLVPQLVARRRDLDPDLDFAALPVRYSADPESLYAHVHITPADTAGLRIVFLWDTQEAAWLYHDLSLMPFPPSSFSSLPDALPSPFPSIARDDDVDDDAYWDAYGANDSAVAHHNASDQSNPTTEDAYWAQYSYVQGSGDSTQPSPIPDKKKLEQHPDDERILLPYPFTHSSNDYNPLRPPSPDSISTRLAAIPVRPDSPTVMSPLDSDTTTPSPPSRPSINGFSSLGSSFAPIDENDALRDSIRGIYRLWKVVKGGSEHQDSFLSIVQQVIDEP